MKNSDRGPLIPWTADDLKDLYDSLSIKKNTSNFVFIKSRVFENEGISDYIRGIDPETRPKYVLPVSPGFNIKLLYNWYRLWYNVFKDLRSGDSHLMVRDDEYELTDVYFLEIFFDTPKDRMPLLIHHTNRKVRKTARWRLSVDR